MATIEELLNLSDKGWQDIASMNDDQLKEYLKDIFILENKIKQSTIYKNKDEDIGDSDSSVDDSVDSDSSSEDDSALSKLKKSTEDEDSPFDKRNKKKYKKKRDKVLSTYDIDLEAEKLKEELGL